MVRDLREVVSLGVTSRGRTRVLVPDWTSKSIVFTMMLLLVRAVWMCSR